MSAKIACRTWQSSRLLTSVVVCAVTDQSAQSLNITTFGMGRSVRQICVRIRQNHLDIRKAPEWSKSSPCPTEVG